MDNTSRYDTFSERDSISLHANSISASHADRTQSEIASSVTEGQFPHRPNKNDPAYGLMRIWLLIAELHLGQDDWHSAALCESEARQLLPGSYHLTHIKGLIEETKGNFEEARQLFENAVAVNPHNAHSLYHLARMHHELKYHRLCVNSLNIALRNSPYCQDLWLLLGNVYETLSQRTDKENDEIDAFKHGARQLDPMFKLATSKMFLSPMYEMNGDHQVTMAGDAPREKKSDGDDIVENTFAGKAAECYAIALSLHNSSPIVPFSSISIAYE